MEEKTMKKVLVVDDDESIRRLLLTLLHFEGYEVDTACDGIEAIERLAAADYDAVVLDLMMPRLDGLGVLDWMGEEDGATDRVIVLTAADSIAVRRKTVATVMGKPFDIQELIDEVARCASLDDELATGTFGFEAWH
jgi:CheY-like chemotaxis protein